VVGGGAAVVWGGDVVGGGASVVGTVTSCAPAGTSDSAAASPRVATAADAAALARRRTWKVNQAEPVRLRMSSMRSPDWFASAPFSPSSAERSASASRLALSVSAVARTASTPSSMIRSA